MSGKSSASQCHRERGRAGSRARTVRERTPRSSRLNRARSYPTERRQ